MQNNIVSSSSDQHAKTLSQESEKDMASVLAGLNDLGSGIATIMLLLDLHSALVNLSFESKLLIDFFE